MTAAPHGLQRPPGYAPRGTSFGLLGCATLMLSPFLTVTSLIPVLPDGFDMFVNTMVASFAASLPLALVIALGLRGRRLWYIYFIFLYCTIELLMYGFGVLIWTAVFFNIFPDRHPELRSVLIVSGIGWLYFTLCAFWVTRMLRLRYWQPWSRPEQWEPGNETPPRWAPPPPTR